jgi:hypothetical protein
LSLIAQNKKRQEIASQALLPTINGATQKPDRASTVLRFDDVLKLGK